MAHGKVTVHRAKENERQTMDGVKPTHAFHIVVPELTPWAADAFTTPGAIDEMIPARPVLIRNEDRKAGNASCRLREKAWDS